MRKRNHRKRNWGIAVTVVLALVVCGGAYYSRWNRIDPQKSCASCHEIKSLVCTQESSSHRELHCSECHGTAFSNGFKGFADKGKMVVSHFTNKNIEEIHMSEEQLLGVVLNCKRCHESEAAKWKSSGHSVDYRSIFLNEEHNARVQINFDCLRCHGMFYDGTIDELVGPISTEGPWEMYDTLQACRPAITCLTCHQIHKPGKLAEQPDYAHPEYIFHLSDREETIPDFYDIHEKTHYSASELPKLSMTQGDSLLIVSDDVSMRNCVQCHAPNAHQIAGTSEDCTPRGVHEGLSCLACHDPHSNDARSSCVKCHPAVSNCNLDVRTMNTAYYDSASMNFVHSVSCSDCHDQK